MLTKYTIENWKKKFIAEMEKQLGDPYWYGGGQQTTFVSPIDGTIFDGIDNTGYPTGKDCSGGIIFALEQTIGIEFALCPPRGFAKKPWLTTIDEVDLQEGDLILVDVPKMKGSSPMQTATGQIEYGHIDHVMTYAPHNQYDIITTEGSGGDQRRNPNSKANTRRWKWSSFKQVSDRIFSGATKYHFRRINWQWLFNWKNKHQV